MIHLETERLVLRPLVESDFESVHAYASDPEVTRFTSFGPNSQQETRDFIEAAHAAALDPASASLELAIVPHAVGHPVGACGVRPTDAAAGAFEIGYVLHRAYWQQGLGSEAVGRLRDHAFDALGARRIIALIFVDNEASQALASKLGFLREETRPRCFHVRGEWHDAVVYAQHADDSR